MPDTALSFTANQHYFGRTLDLDCSYNEEICILPRKFPLEFKAFNSILNHYALIGMATVVKDTPLFCDAANEYGLAMAGLNFPTNAHYLPLQQGKNNITPFELIPFVLGQCKTVNQAQQLLANINLVNIPFSQELPLAPLHWILADKTNCIVIEPMQNEIQIHPNPVGVLTNNPPFKTQLFNLNNYRHLKVTNGNDSAFSNLKLQSYSQGLGGLGLPGDVSSMSRFVRAAFGVKNSVCEAEENASVSQFFHLMQTVQMVRGVCKSSNGWDVTQYTSCINTTLGLYYYTTYNNQQINCVHLNHTNLNSNTLTRYCLINTQQIYNQN